MNNLGMLMNMLKSGGNPQALVQNMMKNNNNPILANAFNLMQQGKENEVEQIARNLCKQKGLNYENSIGNLKNMMGKK